MLRVLTFVRFHPALDPSQAFQQWQTHTDTWDRRDHPEIVRTRLARFVERDSLGYDGFAETVWPDRTAFERAAAWYQQTESAAHYADLCRFLDMDTSCTLVIEEDCVLDGNPA